MDGLKARLSFDAVAYDYDDEYLTIDTDTHIININNLSRLFGVQYDGNSKLIKFRISNKLSDIQKMQDSIVYINWIDSKGVKGQSIAIDKTTSNDICEFAWKVPFDALKNSGVLHFAVSAVVTKNSSSVIDQRWSTQIASVTTPDGIYIKSYTPSSEEEDRIAQIYNELSNMINKQSENLQAQVDSLKEDLSNYLHLVANIKSRNLISNVTRGAKWNSSRALDSSGNGPYYFAFIVNVEANKTYHFNIGSIAHRPNMDGNNFLCSSTGEILFSEYSNNDGKLFEENGNEYVFTVSGKYANVRQLYLTGWNDSYDESYFVEGRYIPETEIVAKVPYDKIEWGSNQPNIINTSKITLPYIKDNKVVCLNKTLDSTAIYTGVNTNGTPTKFTTKFIFEDKENSGTCVMIFNKNGDRKVEDITKSSLHLVITSTDIILTCLGADYGNYYYKYLINQKLTTPLKLDGETENTVEFSVDLDTNLIIVKINTMIYRATFEDEKHPLTDFYGKYVLFEHFSYGDRNVTSLPMFTMFKVEGTDFNPIYDYFERENGVLTLTPQGVPYSLFTNETKYNL